MSSEAPLCPSDSILSLCLPCPEPALCVRPYPPEALWVQPSPLPQLLPAVSMFPRHAPLMERPSPPLLGPPSPSCSRLDLSWALPFPPTEHPQEAQRPPQLLPSSIRGPMGAIGAGGPTCACVTQGGRWGPLPLLVPFPSTVPASPRLQQFWGAGAGA